MLDAWNDVRVDRRSRSSGQQHSHRAPTTQLNGIALRTDQREVCVIDDGGRLHVGSWPAAWFPLQPGYLLLTIVGVIGGAVLTVSDSFVVVAAIRIGVALAAVPLVFGIQTLVVQLPPAIWIRPIGSSMTRLDPSDMHRRIALRALDELNTPSTTTSQSASRTGRTQP